MNDQSPHPPSAPLPRLDAWMASHPVLPRIVPWGFYLVMLAVVMHLGKASPPLYPLLYLVQCAGTVWLLWRYRRLTPELTLSFHWLAVPVGVAGFAAWWWLGDLVRQNLAPEATGTDFYEMYDGYAPALLWTALVMRLIGMSLVVPLFEELFTRSLLLRALSSPRESARTLAQLLVDMPGLGERLMLTRLGRFADARPAAFTRQFVATGLGELTLFGVLASSVLWMGVHQPVDYPGTLACGVLYALLLGFTRRWGLGPVIWAHGITNALLWAYTIYSNDWRFL